MYRKASVRIFFLVLLGLVLRAGHTQDFGRLYSDSVTITLAEPLQWVAVPKGTIASPDAFTAAGSWGLQPYTDSTDLPTSGRQDVWATFSLPATASLQTWFIRLPGQALVKASLFSRGPQGEWLTQSAGEAIAPADWSLRTRVPSFELQTRSDRVQTYYMRFENNRALTGRPMLLSPVEYVDGASRVGVVIGLMWGMFSVLAALSLAAFAMARNRVFLWFGAVVVTLMFTQLVLIGYGGWRIWPGSAHLNQVMGWVSSALSMAAGAWFCAQASYAKSGHPRLYRLLAAVAAGSLLMAGLMAIDRDFIPRDLRNLWLALASVSILGSLVWMSLRGQAWNLLLLLGTAPIALAALARLSYNAGWVQNIEAAQAAGVLSAMVGLLWIFFVLAWRSRAALFSTHRGAALATYDPASGLMLPRVIDSRLGQMLLRARRRRAECGIVMLSWLDQLPSPDELSDQKRSTALSRIGEILRRAARDMDTVVRYEENLFLMLIEGPVNREAVSEISTKVLADSIRLSDKLDDPNAFNLHIAIWHGTPGAQTGQQIIGSLQTRLRRMSSGPKRYVQFVDAAGEPASLPAEDSTRREDLVAKINALETSHPAFHDDKLAPRQAPVR
ncbi:MAG: 7TM diverse intracellular signaling domain-containing protein [Polaromonas sp.]|uniref:sensor domain-containing diguanylate cyclase n=1 Tax=Polaromonas sp. TaxID=1869339 RepID=UPI0027196AA0|nr:7TM diverse intracellular signaling domain-containing protein [Polaromonas sp.]MDO9114262.1 7TM diverse intracellular signaling domain-containing protein [Polaromonas sp.]MDP1886926.1 7TM diverse intracellular signaling domain-containing protein [Polaromonas sp.]